MHGGGNNLEDRKGSFAALSLSVQPMFASSRFAELNQRWIRQGLGAVPGQKRFRVGSPRRCAGGECS